MRVRAEQNKRRPKFIRAEYHRLKRLQTSWRKPKGIDSKMREKRKGKRKSPTTGYRGPRAVRGLHPSGKEIVRVNNIYELEDVNSETQVAQIGSKVGSRKRITINNLAEELDIHIINPQIRRDIEEFDEDAGVIDDFDDLEEEEDDLLLDDDSADLDDASNDVSEEEITDD